MENTQLLLREASSPGYVERTDWRRVSAGVVSISLAGLSVLALLGLGFFETRMSHHSVEMLQNTKMRPAERTGLERRFAFTQSLGFTADNEAIKAEHVSLTCGLLEDRCGHLSGRDKIRCGLKQVCSIHRMKPQCEKEKGDSCKKVLNVASNRKPCYFDHGKCHIRPGWGDQGGAQGQQRALNASIASIMKAATQQKNSDDEAESQDDDAVVKVLKSLGASLTRRHHRRQYNRNRRSRVRRYNPRTRRSRPHRYNRSVRRSANRRARYRQFRAHFYQPRNRRGVTFSFKTGKYSNGKYPRGVYNNSYPTRREGRVNQQNGRRLSRGFRYKRKKNKWEYVKYNHTNAHCHAPACRRPPGGVQGRFNLRNGRGSRGIQRGYGRHGRSGRNGGRGKRSRHSPRTGHGRRGRRNGGREGRGRTRGPRAGRSVGNPRRPSLRSGSEEYPREGRGVIYNGKYIREGYYPRAPFYDGKSARDIPDFENDDAGPREKPFGKTNIVWQPNTEDCGGGGEDHDYGCWEPNDPDFELKVYSDHDPINVKVQWCQWAEEMVPCTPGFGGAYYLPGMRGNDRGIWPEEDEEDDYDDDDKGPIEVYEGRRSDPYIWEEGRGEEEPDDTKEEENEPESEEEGGEGEE